MEFDEIEPLENIVIKKVSGFAKEHPNLTAFIALTSAMAALTTFMYFKDPVDVKKKSSKSYGVIEQHFPYNISQSRSNYKHVYG
ncbi:hypothetical protein C0585_04540 [Candidatus Woesearchaeota archaeon]|nr:MAG: hypothetical protein C0585_04540 [Candidatus Woesearchaeota archaeon]